MNPKLVTELSGALDNLTANAFFNQSLPHPKLSLYMRQKNKISVQTIQSHCKPTDIGTISHRWLSSYTVKNQSLHGAMRVRHIINRLGMQQDKSNHWQNLQVRWWGQKPLLSNWLFPAGLIFLPPRKELNLILCNFLGQDTIKKKQRTHIHIVGFNILNNSVYLIHGSKATRVSTSELIIPIPVPTHRAPTQQHDVGHSPHWVTSGFWSPQLGPEGTACPRP